MSCGYQQNDFLLTEWHITLHGRIETPVRRGGQLCCSFVANLLQYLCAKNYQNTMRFNWVVAKIEGCNFFAPQCSTLSALIRACSYLVNAYAVCRVCLSLAFLCGTLLPVVHVFVICISVEGLPMISTVKFKDHLNMAVGTSTGQVCTVTCITSTRQVGRLPLFVCLCFC